MGHLYIHHSDSLLRQQKLHQKIQMARGCQNTIPITYTIVFIEISLGVFGDGYFFMGQKTTAIPPKITKRLVGFHLPGWMPSNGMEAFLGQVR